MPQTLGRYQLQEEIGHGTMAVVYRAFDPQINRTLAIKVLRSERCQDEEYRQRFLREARAAGKLSHPHIVTIYDVGEEQGRPYIAMELLSGISLDRLLKSARPFSSGEIVAVMLQLASALAYAHRHGIVHRDIKPSNILCAVQGSGDLQASITDFGIAHMADANITLQTGQGELLGTPHYMSPEQVLGRPVDGRSDLFSLGVILYELLSGHKPFRADSIPALMFRIATGDAPPLPQATAPPALLRILEKLLRKSPERRMSSGEQLLRELQHLHGELQHAHPWSRRFGHRLRRGFSGALLLWAIMTATTLGITRLQDGAAQAQQLQHARQLAAVIASETATPLLGGDWTAVELLLRDLAAQPGMVYAVLVDATGVVRGADRQTALGAPYQSAVRETQWRDRDGVAVFIGQAGDADAVHLRMPVNYQQKKVGTLYLGLSAAGAGSLQQQTVALLLLATVLVTLIGAGGSMLAATAPATPSDAAPPAATDSPVETLSATLPPGGAAEKKS